MDDKKKQELNNALENANKIYQDMISSEREKAKEKLKEFLNGTSSLEAQRKKEIELLSQSINSVQNSMQDKFVKDIKDKYIDKYSDIAQSLSDKKEFLEASSALASLGKEINNDIYRYKMDDINIREKQFHNIEYAKPIEFRNYANEMLEEFKIQNEKLNIVIEHLKTQNESLDIQIKNDELSSEKQIAKLQEQIKKIDDSSKSQGIYNGFAIGITLIVAVMSIVFSFKTTKISADKADEIYEKENNSSDKQHEELKKILENSGNKNLILEDKQLNVLNQIFESIKENETIKDKNISK